MTTSTKLRLIAFAAATVGLLLAVLVGIRISSGRRDEGTVVVVERVPPVLAPEPAGPAPSTAPTRVPVAAPPAAPAAPALARVPPLPPAARRPAPPPSAPPSPDVALAPLTIDPVDEAHGGDESALPMGSSPRADLTFLSEAARLENGPPSPAVQRLVALAETGADSATLSAAIDRELAGHLALRLTARRWLATRLGQPAPAVVPPHPSSGVVSGFTP